MDRDWENVWGWWEINNPSIIKTMMGFLVYGVCKATNTEQKLFPLLADKMALKSFEN